MLNTRLRGAVASTLALALSIVPFAPRAQQSNGNEADMHLTTDLKQMRATVQQAQPMPLGGCVSGYSWHWTYGGCRRAETRSETASCPPNYSGSQVRYRTAHVLQANSNDVAYDAWGAWQDGCTPNRGAGYLDQIVAMVRGTESGESANDGTLSGNIVAQLKRDLRVNSNATVFGVTIYRPSAELACFHASATTTGSGESNTYVWTGWQLPPGQSVDRPQGYCHLSNGNRRAELFGSCDRTTGGDSDSCVRVTRTVEITSVNGCTVNIGGSGSYNLC